MRALNAGEHNQERFAVSLSAISQGLFLTFLLIIAIAIVLAILVSFFAWESNNKILNLLAHIAVCGGAVWAGGRSGKRAWLHGVAVGVAAFLLFNWMGGRQGLFVAWLWWKRLLRMGFVSMLGGILGGLFKP